ncbi:MAG: glycosyltransferase family 4 protein [Bacteroidales bacterium]|nr:glycosyltransferase family 4 protein [Bacteroidales bacterium]
MESLNRLNLLYLGTGGEGFPVGGAYVNRIVALSKSLIKNGNRITVLVLYPGKSVPAEFEGEFEGISYVYAVKKAQPGTRLSKLLLALKGSYKATSIARKIHKKQKIDCIISSTSNPLQVLFFYLFTRIYGIKMIREKNEYPLVILYREKYPALYRKLYLKYFYRLFDGMLVINNALYDFFKDRIRKNAKIEFLPMVVEPERFDLDVEREKIVTYCGHLWGNKDGVPILIEAFAAVSADFPDYSLQIIGKTTGNDREFEAIKQKIRALGIEGRVIFTGFIEREKIPAYLCASSCLALARPPSVQAEGGFPIKLGEYLATGNPVVTTTVGEIPLFLKDGENAFLALPGDVTSFTAKLREALENPERAKEIGLKGKRVAQTSFNYEFQAERIVNFIKSL